MPIYYDEKLGRWVDTEREAALADQASRMPAGLDQMEQLQWQRDQESKSAQKQFDQQVKSGNAGAKPLLAKDGGQALEEVGNILGNTVTGLVTDYFDVGAGLADVAVQAGNLATGKGWDWNKVFDDSDNPWTHWRQQNFEAETQAGQVVSNVARVASMLLTMPKTALKGIALPFRIANATRLPLAAEAAGSAVKRLNAADDFLKAGSKASQATTAAMEGLDFAKGTNAAKAAGRAGRNSWLQATYKEIADVPEARTWFQSVGDSVKSLAPGAIAKRMTPRNVAEAIGWDAFVAFNVYGEGDDSFDETITDMLSNSGLPHLPFLKTELQDAGVVRKLKQMAEGVATGAALNQVIDMARVYQFSRAFSGASDAEKVKIAQAFQKEAGELGSGLAGLLTASAESLQAGRTAAFEKGARLGALYNQLETEKIGQRYQNDLLTAQLRNNAVAEVGYDPQLQAQLTQGQGLNPQQLLANQGMVANSQEALPGTMPAGLLPEGQVRQLPGGAAPGMLPGGPEAKPPGAPPAGLLGAGGELLPPVQQVQVADVTPRPPAPAVTPQTIRNAFQADAYDVFKRAQELTFEEGPDGIMRSMSELRDGVKRLMPQTRVDALEYFQNFRPQANDLGVIPAADSVWMNFITDRGLSEGWASIDPSTMTVRFNRKFAVELDRGDLAAKQAEAWDELNSLERFKQQFADQVAGIEAQKNELLGQMDQMAGEQEGVRYQAWLAGREPMNPGSMDPRVQENLAAKETRDAYDQWEAQQTAARAAEPDPASADMERKLVTSAVEADQFDAAEELRLSEAELAGMTGNLDDATVVREYLGTTLDSVQRPEVVKAEVGRGWEVYGVDGELIGKSTTKKAAEKLADGEQRRLRDAVLARARQMEADAADEAMNVATGSPVYESNIVGKIKLTDSQIEAIQKFSPGIQRQMNANWEKRTGGKAWININELGGSQKTFELTQGEMYDIVDGIKALLQTGEIAGPRARVLRNIADKMDTTMKLLEPEARAQRFANDIAADAQRFIDHGDFC